MSRVAASTKQPRPVATSTHQALPTCCHQHPQSAPDLLSPAPTKPYLQAAELVLCGSMRGVAAGTGSTGRLQLLLQRVQRLQEPGPGNRPRPFLTARRCTAATRCRARLAPHSTAPRRGQDALPLWCPGCMPLDSRLILACIAGTRSRPSTHPPTGPGCSTHPPTHPPDASRSFPPASSPPQPAPCAQMQRPVQGARQGGRRGRGQRTAGRHPTA